MTCPDAAANGAWNRKCVCLCCMMRVLPFTPRRSFWKSPTIFPHATWGGRWQRWHACLHRYPSAVQRPYPAKCIRLHIECRRRSDGSVFQRMTDRVVWICRTNRQAKGPPLTSAMPGRSVGPFVHCLLLLLPLPLPGLVTSGGVRLGQSGRRRHHRQNLLPCNTSPTHMLVTYLLTYRLASLDGC